MRRAGLQWDLWLAMESTAGANCVVRKDNHDQSIAEHAVRDGCGLPHTALLPVHSTAWQELGKQAKAEQPQEPESRATRAFAP